jgi:hypothetical protein
VLGLPTSGIGKKADFLSLGGDSIAAISLASIARSARCLLSIKGILKNPILEKLAPMMLADTRDVKVLKPSYKTPASVVDAVHETGLRMDDVEYGKH